MLCIYLKVKVQYTVIQQLFSTSVPLPLPMIDYDVFEEILKFDVQKEDDAVPTVTLWDSWFYISWKSDRDMIHPIAEKWQHYLDISEVHFAVVETPSAQVMDCL